MNKVLAVVIWLSGLWVGLGYYLGMRGVYQDCIVALGDPAAFVFWASGFTSIFLIGEISIFSGGLNLWRESD